MGSTCQVCGTVLAKNGEGVRICPTCRQGAHQECWTHLGGCVTPACREAARKSESEARAACTTMDLRREALARRRLGWIVAQELGAESSVHPEEIRLRMGMVACGVVALTAWSYGIELVAQVFGASAFLILGLLLSHRRDRNMGRIHRWIPAGNAPPVGLRIADWILWLDHEKVAVAIADFGRHNLGEPEDRQLLERAERAGMVAVDRSADKVGLTEAARNLLEEARSRVAPSLRE